MNKLAAEKIASEYYNLGVQFAMEQAGLTKTANMGKRIGKALGLTGLAAASPAALASMKEGLGGATGEGMLEILKTLAKGEGQYAKQQLKHMPYMLGEDASALQSLGSSALGKLQSMGAAAGSGLSSMGDDAVEYLSSFKNLGGVGF